MDSDIETFRDQVRRYIAAEMAPKLPGWREQGYIPRETWRPFGEMGFLLPEMPEAYGGASASIALIRLNKVGVTDPGRGDGNSPAKGRPSRASTMLYRKRAGRGSTQASTLRSACSSSGRE